MRTAQRLDAVCDLTMGQAPIGESYNNNRNGLPLIAGAGDFGEMHPAAKKFTSAPGKVCEPGDIVLGIRASIGEKVVADREYCLGRGVAGLRARAGLDSRYLWHWLTHVAPTLGAKAKGATFKQVNREDIGELAIALPPLAEQRRIAEVLDRAEALRAKRRTTLAQLDTLTQSIFLDMFGDPATNPKAFPALSLGELGEWKSGGTPSRERADYFVGAIPWFSSGELAEMYVGESHEHISLEALKESPAKAVPRGSLMLGMYDTAALKSSIANFDCSCNQAIAFACIDSKLADTVFVYFAIIIGREHFRRLQRGVRQKNLNLSMVREIRIPVPTIDMQRAFVERVTKVHAVRDLHRASLAELDIFFSSLQHRAFRGEL